MGVVILEFLDISLGILASVLSIYSVIKSKESEKKVEVLVDVLNKSGIEVNFSKGKKNKQMIVKDNSNGIMGNKNSVNFGRRDEDDRRKW